MNALPAELLHQILTYLPTSSLTTARLVSRTLAHLAFPLCFSHLPKWLDYTFSHQTIIALAQDAYNRPAVMWSPWASEPSGEVREVFLSLVWRLLAREDVAVRISLGKAMGGVLDRHDDVEEVEMGLDARESSNGDELSSERQQGGEGEPILLTPDNFATLSGVPDLSAKVLQTGQNRFLLYRSYTRKVAEEREWKGGRVAQVCMDREKYEDMEVGMVRVES